MNTQTNSEENVLLTPTNIGDIKLSHRVVMAPLTRMRAKMPGNIPWELNAEYYAQRSSDGGFIISEATPVSPFGHGYYATPGIHTQAQVEGWKLVTEAVHQKGGSIFLQLWHVGRQSHQDLQPGNVLPVGPSAISAGGTAITKDGDKPHPVPRALRRAEIAVIVEEFRRGAINAQLAGFDGVEIHGANGYLLEQFLSDDANQRTDDYGGSLPNRARFFLEVVQAVVEVWGSRKVGVRISPSNTFGGIEHSNRWETYSYLVQQLNKFRLGYVHLVEPRVAGNVDVEPQHDLGSRRFRPLLSAETKLISAGGHNRETGIRTIASGEADLVAYGRQFISNPDLPRRFALNAPLNPYDRKSFYGGTEVGYTDYPTLDVTVGA